jgi:phospholipid-binding lipoprotein MlaA
MTLKTTVLYAAAVLGAALVLAPSAAAADDDIYADYGAEYASVPQEDPFEGFNRAVFSFNNAVDEYLAAPVARVYRRSFPEVLRRMVRNALKNMRQPVSAVNHILQGDPGKGAHSLWGFWINTSLGGGFMNVMKGSGPAPEEEDFGQTLARAGAGSGPYLVLPFLGPSSLRDAGGFAVDSAMSPSTYLFEDAALAAFYGVRAVDGRERALNATDEIKASAPFDLYAAYRSAYFQHRVKQIEE